MTKKPSIPLPDPNAELAPTPPRRKAKAVLPGQQTAHLFQSPIPLAPAAGARGPLDYLLFLPRNYDPARSRRWPLILFLHGAGERGRILDRITAHGPPKMVQSQPDFPFVVVSPQCPKNQYWGNEILRALLNHVLAEHAIDRRRVYLTGISMGGYGTWNLALTYPDLFAAAAPICGGGDILPILLADGPRLRALRALPVWAFHGAKDAVVPVHESERMVDALRHIGNRAKLTIYPELGHECWAETYENPALFQWFLAHPSKQPIRTSTTSRAP